MVGPAILQQAVKRLRIASRVLQMFFTQISFPQLPVVSCCFTLFHGKLFPSTRQSFRVCRLRKYRVYKEDGMAPNGPPQSINETYLVKKKADEVWPQTLSLCAPAHL
jgi:hypothetical protein